ncbi:MAG: ATP-grasp domain-containing protein, partial [Holophagales bacterium]|nr:ATP-grasp domain-containing protein [Holophagales bacterium]
MPYLIVDPIGDYAGRLKTFLDRMALPAIAVFSSRARHGKWQRKWRHLLGQHVIGVYGVDAYVEGDDDADVRGEMRQLAREIREDHGEAFYGIVPWDEMHTLFAAELSDLLDLGWSSREVMERCRDKYVMKAWLREYAAGNGGRPRINASRAVKSPEQALAFQEELGRWPVVVKPASAAGAVGVTFASDAGELERGCERIQEEGLGKILLEEYVGGEEFAVNGLVDAAGDFMVTDVWVYDKRDSHGERNLYYQSIKVSTHEPPFWDLVHYAAQVITGLGIVR